MSDVDMDCGMVEVWNENNVEQSGNARQDCMKK
jgi:hypothetical protein